MPRAAGIRVWRGGRRLPPGVAGWGGTDRRREPGLRGNWSFAASGGGREGEARAAAATERQNGCCTRGSDVSDPRAAAGPGERAQGRDRKSAAAILEPGTARAGRKAGGGHLRCGRRLGGLELP